MAHSLPEYENWDALEIAERVGRGDVTSLEVAQAAIERIETYNPQLNCVVHTQFEQALRLAQSSMSDGPFTGSLLT